MAEIPFLVLIVCAVAVGLWVSNILYDLKVPHYIARKIGHMTGGLGYLLSLFIFQSSFWPVIITTGFCVVLGLAKLFRPSTFRGVGGTGRGEQEFGEVLFPLSSLIVILWFWRYLNKPEYAILSILFMAWGDAVGGLIRSQVYDKPTKGIWGSLGMLATCCIISWALAVSLPVGIIGAICAVWAERTFGSLGAIKKIDDNFAIPLIAALAMSIFDTLIGGL